MKWYVQEMFFFVIRSYPLLFMVIINHIYSKKLVIRNMNCFWKRRSYLGYYTKNIHISSKRATFAAKLINIMAKNNLMESGLTSDLLLIIKNIYDNINVFTTCAVDSNASIIMIKNTWTINRERLQREKEQQKCDALE